MPAAAAPAVRPTAQPVGPAPVVQKPATPKKETARIQLPPEPKSMPKATIKLEQTQPFQSRPAAQVPMQVPVSSGDSGDGLVVFSVLAFIGSAVACAVQVLAFLSGSPQ